MQFRTVSAIHILGYHPHSSIRVTYPELWRAEGPELLGFAGLAEKELLRIVAKNRFKFQLVVMAHDTVVGLVTAS